MDYTNTKNITASTITFRIETKYTKIEDEHGYIIAELIEWVRDGKTLADAIHNAKTILKNYDSRKTFKEKLKALFS